MRDEQDEVSFVPQPGLDGIDLLLEEVTRTGLPVELDVAATSGQAPRQFARGIKTALQDEMRPKGLGGENRQLRLNLPTRATSGLSSTLAPSGVRYNGH
jgi:hypothetical protein